MIKSANTTSSPLPAGSRMDAILIVTGIAIGLAGLLWLLVL
jgi:hypothetical protein